MSRFDLYPSPRGRRGGRGAQAGACSTSPTTARRAALHVPPARQGKRLPDVRAGPYHAQVAWLAISKDFLTEYVRLDKRVQRSVDQAIATFARHPHPAQYLQTSQHPQNDQLRIMPLDGPWRGIVLAPATGDTYCLVTVLPHDMADAYVSSPEGLQLILAQPFGTWRTFLHPDQRQIAYPPGYSGPAQVTGGPGTGKTVTVLHRAALLAERSSYVLVTTFNGNLDDTLAAPLDLLIPDSRMRQKIEVLNVDRLAYGVVKQARGAPVIADERV